MHRLIFISFLILCGTGGAFLSGCGKEPPVVVPKLDSDKLPVCIKTAPIWSERWVECKDCTPPFRIKAPVRLQTGVKCVKFAGTETEIK